MNLIKEVYKITDSFPKSEIFGIVSQIRRASVSVASNIAEGASRSSTLERRRFYQIARSSLVEVDTQIEISMELSLVSGGEIRSIEIKLNQLFAMLTSMINKTK